ncbi:MAG: adenine deaminase [Bacteroidia bacterium]
MVISGNVVDILNQKIFAADVEIEGSIIKSINPTNKKFENYIFPGFIDAHVHIESSLLIPSEFAKLAVTHGTVATVSDPHEIANVCGMGGIDFMINNSKTVPFYFFFGAPSCVPATVFETAGAEITSKQVDELLKRDEILYLSEMMNFPGVLNNDAEVMAKIGSAKKFKKPVDGHAPGLMGEFAKKYFDAGITTDHECFTIEEAEEKLKLGVKVLIREGSAARNFDALIPLIDNYWQQIMFCSDDKHPDELLVGHINKLVSSAVALGYDIFKVLRAACINPIIHYNLPVGYLQVGQNADFIVVNNLTDFVVLQTYIKGKCVAQNGKYLFETKEEKPINNFGIDYINESEIVFEHKPKYQVIECIDGQLITNNLTVYEKHCTIENDILKMVVVNRYKKAKIATAFVKNFGLKKGAIASSVAHDSHNIIAVGINETEICNAVNLIVKHKGGLSAVNKEDKLILPLEVAGLMSNQKAETVAQTYSQLHHYSRNQLGSKLRAPFMSLSFMALLVIPHLKLSDKGLFNGDNFTFTN